MPTPTLMVMVDWTQSKSRRILMQRSVDDNGEIILCNHNTNTAGSFLLTLRRTSIEGTHAITMMLMGWWPQAAVWWCGVGDGWMVAISIYNFFPPNWRIISIADFFPPNWRVDFSRFLLPISSRQNDEFVRRTDSYSAHRWIRRWFDRQTDNRSTHSRICRRTENSV